MRSRSSRPCASMRSRSSRPCASMRSRSSRLCASMRSSMCPRKSRISLRRLRNAVAMATRIAIAAPTTVHAVASMRLTPQRTGAGPRVPRRWTTAFEIRPGRAARVATVARLSKTGTAGQINKALSSRRYARFAGRDAIPLLPHRRRWKSRLPAIGGRVGISGAQSVAVPGPHRVLPLRLARQPVPFTRLPAQPPLHERLRVPPVPAASPLPARPRRARRPSSLMPPPRRRSTRCP